MAGNEEGDQGDQRFAADANREQDSGVALLLRERMASLSRAERKIASHILENVARLPLETGASIARVTGVSEMTVGRFVRSLGFANLKALKRRVEAERPDMSSNRAPLPVGHRFTEQDLVNRRFRADLDAVAEAHALAGQQSFRTAMRLLEHAPTIHVLGLPAVRGLAFDFASRLLWLRPGITFLEADQAHGIALAHPGKNVLVLIDGAPFDGRARQIATEAKAAGVPLIILGEGDDAWVWEKTAFVFRTSLSADVSCPSRTGLQVMAGLALNAVATGLGHRARSRYQAMLEARSRIDQAFSGSDRIPGEG